MSAIEPPAQGSDAGSKISGFFRSWSVIGSVLTALAIAAALARWNTIAWPEILRQALIDYQALVDFLLGFFVPAGWPRWSIDLMNIYLWAGVAVYIAGFSRWGPEKHKTLLSRMAWQLVDIAASAIWPVTLLAVLILGTLLSWAFARAFAAFAELAIGVMAVLQRKDRSEYTAISLPRATTAFFNTTRFVLTAVAWVFARTLAFLALILFIAAILNAATSDLPNSTTPPRPPQQGAR